MSDIEPPPVGLFPTISFDPPNGASSPPGEAEATPFFPALSLEPTFGPRDPWAEAVHTFDKLRADIRKLPQHKQPAAWGCLLTHVRAARAEILGPPDE
ncbi:hypothetical protein [Kitasatospora sp. NPDC051164]|uniref:hypothetical protein n=1 Tax=Kitasatospora sp. NPDC051164 TaxID=3364055 RepID=UPI003797ABB0